MTKTRSRNATGIASARVRIMVIVCALITIVSTRYFIVAHRETEARKLGYRIEQYRRDTLAAERMNERLRGIKGEVSRRDVLRENLRAYGITFDVPALTRVTHMGVPSPAEGHVTRQERQR